jgi:uncharacterized membrane protein YgaE (UPF0421/DUF939 family)
LAWRIALKDVQLALRASAAAGLALAIAETLELQHPIYAMIAAVIATDLSPAESRKLALRRLAATAAGAFCGALLSASLGPGPLPAALSIFAAMLVSSLLHAQEGARVAGYICGLVVLYHGEEPWTYAYFRFVETILGIAIAVLISAVPKLLRHREPAP